MFAVIVIIKFMKEFKDVLCITCFVVVMFGILNPNDIKINKNY